MVGHDDVGIAADLEILAGNALSLEHRHLFDEHARVDHDTVTDNRYGVRIHHARRHEMQREFRVAVDYCVTCVVAALITNNEIVVVSNEVGNLTLALVAPLGADQHCVHGESFRIDCANDYIRFGGPIRSLGRI